MSTLLNNYTVGKGRVLLSAFKPGTQDPVGYRFIGNAPDLSIKIDSKTLDHYSSTAGLREKDAQAILETTRTGSITTDNLGMENIAVFFLGETLTAIRTAVLVTGETLTDIVIGYTYYLGTATYASGARGLNASTLVLKKGAATLVAGTDYLVNEDSGSVEFLSGGSLANGDDITVEDYHLKAATHNSVISGTTPFEGSLRFEAEQSQGEKIDVFLPWVKLTPNGDYSLISDSWTEMKFDVEVLKPASKEAIYANGVPVYA